MFRFLPSRLLPPRALRGAALAAGLTLGLAAPPAPAAEVTLEISDLVPLGPGTWLGAGLDLPAPDRALPLVGDRVHADAARVLQRLAGRGVAQGFAGILYDNRDRAHSSLSADSFPRLLRLGYGPELKARNADYGLAGALLLPAVVFGNSSTAITGGDVPRSLVRLAMTTREGPAASARLYRNNHLYVYPEHRDHDAVDRFPAHWPYAVISQGSSGSDRRFLEAIAGTLAAFRPETFAALREARLVAPTVQMILRANLAGVAGREGYFTAAAHPVVIDGARLRPGRMLGQAAALAPGEIPPLVRLVVEAETFRSEAGLAGRSEQLFDTPQAVARLWRSLAGAQEMVVSAARTVDPNGRDLTFRWEVLQGDPARVEITPLDPAGSRARIRMLWHDPWEVPAAVEGEDVPQRRQLSRLDIGVFAENGAWPSAPAMISVDLPEHQVRAYAEAPGTPPRLISVNYDAEGRGAGFDPLLYWTAPWTDVPVLAADGSQTGWRRTHRDGRLEEVPRAGPYEITGSRRIPVLTPVSE